MTGNTNKARAVFLAMLMVFSVFAGTVAFSGSAAADQSSHDFVGGAVHYENVSSGVTDNNDSVIEIPFDGPIDPASIDANNFTVLDDGDNISSQINYSESKSRSDGGKVELIIDDGNLINSQDLEVDLSSTVANTPGEKSVAFAATTVDLAQVGGTTGEPSSNVTSFQGTVIAFQDTNSTKNSGVSGFTIEDDEDAFSYFQQFSAGENSTVFFFDTGTQELGEYEMNGSSQFLTIRNLGLTAEADDLDVTIGDDIEGTVSSRASNQNIEVELIDDAGDGDTVDSIGTATSGQGDFDFTFSTSGLDEGDYAVEVTDNGSGVTTQTSAIQLTESDADTSFAEGTISDARGDIVPLTVEMEDTDFATITLGEVDGSEGVVANVTVEDESGDGQATVYLNTFSLEGAAGSASADEVFAVDSDSDDSVTKQDVSTDVSNLIDAGEYDLEVIAGQTPAASTTGGADGVATLVLNERSTDTLRTWTGSSGELSPSSLEDVNEAIANGEITQSSDIAVGDFAVHQLVASGFEGALDARENEDVTSQFLQLNRSGPINLTIEEADPGANQDASALNINSSDNLTVIGDGPNDTYFILVDTEQVNFNDGADVPSDDDTELETNFTVLQDDAGFDFTPDGEFDDDENSETFVEFTAEEPEASIDEPFDVPQADGQTVSGTTNIAPGTELNLRVRSQDGVTPSFLKSASPVVQSDGTFSGTFDFSEQNVGDDYDIIVSDTLLASNEEESGTIVEAVATDTATPEPDTETATPEPDTDTPTPEPDTETATPEPDTATPEPETEEPTSTPTSTPGFGVVVALTALLAAALLAIRRE